MRTEKDYLSWNETVFLPTVLAYTKTTSEDVLYMAVNNAVIGYTRKGKAALRLAAASGVLMLYKVNNISYSVSVYTVCFDRWKK